MTQWIPAEGTLFAFGFVRGANPEAVPLLKCSSASTDDTLSLFDREKAR
jgi:hypothetical protein